MHRRCIIWFFQWITWSMYTEAFSTFIDCSLLYKLSVGCIKLFFFLFSWRSFFFVYCIHTDIEWVLNSSNNHLIQPIRTYIISRILHPLLCLDSLTKWPKWMNIKRYKNNKQLVEWNSDRQCCVMHTTSFFINNNSVEKCIKPRLVYRCEIGKTT